LFFLRELKRDVRELKSERDELKVRFKNRNLEFKAIDTQKCSPSRRCFATNGMSKRSQSCTPCWTSIRQICTA
jgi:hypothetical protein